MKILGIVPLSKEYSKNLKVNTVYTFYNDYNIEKNNAGEIKVQKQKTINFDAYDIDRSSASKQTQIKVNISALVGKNGSGKSTLLEMLYIFCFILSVKKNLLHFKELKIQRDIPEKVKHLIDNFAIEIIYELKSNVYQISYDGRKIRCKKLENGIWKVISFEFKNFFYTIGINYSLYGNNSVVDQWLKYIFHKNDGYQSPIVLNPFRENGTININLEHHLAQSRLLSNITSYQDLNPILIDSKRIEKIEFLLFPATYEKLNAHRTYDIIDRFENFHDSHILKFVNELTMTLAKYNIDDEQIGSFKRQIEQEKQEEGEFYNIKNSPRRGNYVLIEYEFIKYIIRKVYKICTVYNDYNQFLIKNEKEDNLGIDKESTNLTPVINNTRQLIQKLHSDRSHITLKLRQAIYTLKSSLFLNLNVEVNSDISTGKYYYRFEMLFNEYSEHINRLYEQDDNVKLEKVDIIPGSVVKPIIHFLNESNFSSLSSGEQQFLHSIHSLIYHLNNLNSVHKNSSKGQEIGSKHGYKNINIILDEIELYFHPEYQRKFVNSILLEFRKTNLDHISNINIIFSTHSPFILSDIPDTNILCLETGSPSNVSFSQKTFGANIHDLLANQFFLDNGFMGDFAKSTINKIIQYLNAKASVIKLNSISEDFNQQVRDSALIRQKKILEETIAIYVSGIKDWYPNIKSRKNENYIEIIESINPESILTIIEKIGEPILKNKLKGMFKEIFSDSEIAIKKKETEFLRLAQELNYNVTKKQQ